MTTGDKLKRKVSHASLRRFLVTAAATTALATLAACSTSLETTGAAATRPGAIALPSPTADAPAPGSTETTADAPAPGATETTADAPAPGSTETTADAPAPGSTETTADAPGSTAPTELAQALADRMQNLRDEARNEAAKASDDSGGARAVADDDDDEPEASAGIAPDALVPAEELAPSVAKIEPEVVAPAPSEPTLPVAPAASEPPAPPAGGVDCSVSKCIALTFDDGPSKYTPGVLDTLKARNAKATFFVLGQAVERNPGTARRIVNEGSEIAVHTWNHPQLSKIGAAKVEWQLTSTRDAIQRATGVTPAWMRPPYGDIGGSARQATARVGYPVALWNVDTLDWQNRSAATTKRRALAGAKPGAIILMHDIHPYAPQMLPELIDELHDRGYHLVTMSELMRGKHVQPGVSYTRR
ncbi:polysaccharide deacetylase family protein [Micrococcales bacterium 31B]|nr:polysaccharide deacetylase family protein [Micrococcales bacterium 31B]